jgi:uncharacterized protein YeaO (DUF488 family)
MMTRTGTAVARLSLLMPATPSLILPSIAVGKNVVRPGIRYMAGVPFRPAASFRASWHDESVPVDIARVYEEKGQDPRGRILVDRLWPRGLARADAPFEWWAKDAAPSTELRKWFDHIPERFEEFGRRYRTELTESPGREAVNDLRRQLQAGPIVLLTAAKDLRISGAAVLRDVVAAKRH